MVDGGSLVFLEDQIFESLISSDIMVPLKIPAPTPAPDLGGPVACLGTFRIWGLVGSGGPFVTVNLIKRLAQKLCRMVLSHFGLIIFRVHLGRTRKPLFLMVFGPSGCDHDSPNQLFSTSETPRYSK